MPKQPYEPALLEEALQEAQEMGISNVPGYSPTEYEQQQIEQERVMAARQTAIKKQQTIDAQKAYETAQPVAKTAAVKDLAQQTGMSDDNTAATIARFQANPKAQEFTQMPIKDYKALARAAGKQYEESTIKLTGGKRVDIADWNDIPQKYQSIGLRKGFDAMLNAMKKDDRDFNAKNIIIRGQAISVNEWNKLDPKYQSTAIKSGFDAMVNKMERDIKQDNDRYNRAINAVSLYEIEPGKYDLDKFMDDNPGQRGTLKDAGFADKDIKQALSNAELKTTKYVSVRTGNVISKEQYKALGYSSKADEFVLSPASGKGATVKKAVPIAIDMIVPGLYVAKNWKDLNIGEKALYIGLDALSLVPIAGTAIKSARTVGVAGKVARLSKAGKAAIAETGRLAVAPVEMLIHPIGTAKATTKQIRNIAEVIAHPKRLSELVVTTSTGTVRLEANRFKNPAQAAAARDMLMEAVQKGGGSVFLEVGDKLIELKRSPLMRELKGGLSHATPMGEKFSGVLKVSAKPGMPLSEQGLFLSHEPLPKFAQASAFGQKGEKGAILIFDKTTAAKSIPTGKIYDSPFGKVAELEKKLPVGFEKKVNWKQRLFIRVGPESARVELWLEKPLKASQIAKLKAEGILEALKAPFKEPVTFKNAKALNTQKIKALSTELKAAGNIDEAENLVRAERLISSEGRIAAASALRDVSPSDVKRARTELETISARNTTKVEQTPIEKIRAAEVADTRGRITTTDTRGRIITKRDSRGRIDERDSRGHEGKKVERAETLRREADDLRRKAERLAKESPKETRRIETLRKEATRLDRKARDIERIKASTARQPRSMRVPDTPRTPRSMRVPDTPRTPRTPRTSSTPEIPITPKEPGKRFSDNMTPKEKLKIMKASNGLVAWRQGRVGTKDVWHVLKYPYETEDDYTTLIGKTPPGAKVVTGPSSAFITASRLYGKAPSRQVKLDMGIQDVVIDNKARIKFTPDPKQLTTGDISIGDKKGKVFPLENGKK